MAAATATSGALRVLLERAADPSPSTPLVLPYLTGERAPGWAGDARAILSGVSAASTPADLFRWIVDGGRDQLRPGRRRARARSPDAVETMGRTYEPTDRRVDHYRQRREEFDRRHRSLTAR